MPLGLQLLAPHGADARLLEVGADVEGALAAGRPVPPLAPVEPPGGG